jgi:hypothetical protein
MTCLQLLAQRLKLADPEAADSCQRLQSQGPPSDTGAYSVAVSSALSYQVPDPWKHGYIDPAVKGPPEDGIWDMGASWYPWAEQPDPVHALHLDLVWGTVPLQVRPQVGGSPSIFTFRLCHSRHRA